MKRINEYVQTSAMAMDVLAKSMNGKVYNLAAGDPNLSVPDALISSYKIVDFDATHNYGPSQGLLKLRKKIWNDPEQVIISNGAKQLMYMSMAAVTQPKDKIILIGPCWTSYVQVAKILDLDYVLLTGDEADNYVPPLSKVAEVLDEKTAAVIINNPNNPTGTVYTEDYLNGLLLMVKQKNVWLISDEIYKDLSSKKVVSFRGDASVITIDGLSKSYNITGWRLGYAIAPREVIKSMTSLQSQMSGPPSTLIQNIVSEAWDGLKKSSFGDYKERIDILCGNEKFRRHRPDGAFYFYVPIDDRWESSISLCEYMLDRYKIVLTPGDDYGVERTVRISVANIGLKDLTEIANYLMEI